MKNIAITVTVLLSASTALAAWNSTPYYTTNINGDYVVGGASARNISGFVDVTVAGIPAGATVTKAFAVWNHLTNTPGASSNTDVFIDGNAITGALTGTGADLCWGFTSGAGYIADVTPYVSGNGTYSFRNVGDNNDPTDRFAEGVSVLAIYEYAADPVREVSVYAGYLENVTADAAGSYDFNGAWDGNGPVKFFINGLDGQDSPDEFYFNGNNAGGAIAGTNSATDAWFGLVGPFYDHVVDDVSGWMNSNTGLDFNSPSTSTPGVSDCVGHSFGAVSFTVPEPASLTLLALAALTLRRR